MEVPNNNLLCLWLKVYFKGISHGRAKWAMNERYICMYVSAIYISLSISAIYIYVKIYGWKSKLPYLRGILLVEISFLVKPRTKINLLLLWERLFILEKMNRLISLPKKINDMLLSESYKWKMARLKLLQHEKGNKTSHKWLIKFHLWSLTSTPFNRDPLPRKC